eukprot:gene16463-19579_t
MLDGLFNDLLNIFVIFYFFTFFVYFFHEIPCIIMSYRDRDKAAAPLKKAERRLKILSGVLNVINKQPSGIAPDQPGDPDQQYSAQEGCNEVTDTTAQIDVQPAKNGSTDPTSNQSKYHINNKTIAISFHYFSGKPTSNAAQ